MSGILFYIDAGAAAEYDTAMHVCNVQFNTQFFDEEGKVVGVVPELRVSSFGDTVDEASASLKEAVELFIEECERMGTLTEVLEEAGFRRAEQNGTIEWRGRKPLLTSQERIQMVPAA